MDCSPPGFSVHGNSPSKNRSRLPCPTLGHMLFSHSVTSNSLWHHGMQHTRLPCHSLSPEIFTSSCPLNNCLMLLVSFLFCLQSFSPSRFIPQKLAVQVRWPKCWNFNFNISSSSEYSELSSIRIDWFDLLAVQGTLKSPLQHHSLKVSTVQCSLCVHSVTSDSLWPHEL